MLSTTFSQQLKPHCRSFSKLSKSRSSKLKHSAPASISKKHDPSQSRSASSPRAADLKPASAFAEDEWVPPGLRGRAPPTIDIKSPKYRSAARRVTLAMIAAPIAIVTSYHLAMRTWGGVEQKKLDIKQEQEDA